MNRTVLKDIGITILLVSIGYIIALGLAFMPIPNNDLFIIMFYLIFFVILGSFMSLTIHISKIRSRKPIWEDNIKIRNSLIGIIIIMIIIFVCVLFLNLYHINFNGLSKILQEIGGVELQLTFNAMVPSVFTYIVVAIFVASYFITTVIVNRIIC